MEDEIKHYDNGTSFKFITTIGEKFGDTLTALNEFVFGVIESKPYTLNWEKILNEFERYKEEHGKVNIDEFAYNYVIGYSLVNKFAADDPLREAMYLHLRAELNAKKAKGDLG